MEKARDDQLLQKVAHRIKQLRAERKITQEVFYHDTGINIGRIERAKRDVSVTTLYRICRYFNIALDDFFQDLS